MTDDQDKREPIKPPTKDHPGDKVRAYIEASIDAPAFQFLLGLITEGWISEEIQPDYPAPFVGPLPEDRARFRRFIASRQRAL
jgi:hypothetical protein